MIRQHLSIKCFSLIELIEDTENKGRPYIVFHDAKNFYKQNQKEKEEM